MGLNCYQELECLKNAATCHIPNPRSSNRLNIMTSDCFSLPNPPKTLTTSFYQASASFEDVDSAMWLYLCGLVPEDERPYRDRVAEMLNSVSTELRRYYLARGFDWERGSGGLEGCLMREQGDDDLFLHDTIRSFESLGASKHAAIIRELMPKATERWKRINEADAKGEEFDYDDGFWEPYEERWDSASEEFDFYSQIWVDIQAHPERYVHGK